MKAVLFKVILLVLAVCLFPAVLELVLRVADYGDSSALLITSPAPEQDAWVDNQSFTVPFFSKSLKRTPAPIVVPRKKAANELRIVVLGASAAMGDPMPEFGLPRVLQALLEASVTGKTVRVINAAITAINSHVVRVMPKEVLKIQPDAVVIYLGNNEIVGPFGPGTIFSGFYKNRFWIKAATRVRRSRTGKLLTAMREALSGEGSVRREWAGMEMFLESQLTRDDPDVVIARSHFRANVEDVVRAFADQDVPVILSTVAVNLDDFPPLLAPDEDRSFEEGKNAEANGDRKAAWDLFQQSCDNDRLRFRADTGINDAIRAVAKGNRAVIPVDAAAYFRDVYVNGTSASALYVDHVHFTFNGNYQLARLIADALSDSLPINSDALNAVSESTCRDRLAYSSYAEQVVWEKMQNRFLRPLFRSQPGRIERLQAAVKAEAAAAELKHTDDAAEQLDLINSFLVTHPDDVELLLWRGRYFLNHDQLENALADFRSAAELRPHRITAPGHVSFIETLLNGADSAIATFNKSRLGRGREAPSMMYYVGTMLFDNDRHEDALAWLKAGVDADETYPGMLTQLGYITLLLGKPDDAIPIFEDALKVNPNDDKARSYLGVSYGELNYWRKALQNLKEAVEHSPEKTELRYNYAVGLMKDGKYADAAQEFSRVIEQIPTDLHAVVHYTDVLWEMGLLDEAVDVATQAADFFPDLPLLPLRRAMIEARNNNVNAALNALQLLRDKTHDYKPDVVSALSAWLEATRAGDNAGPSSALTEFLNKRQEVSSQDVSALTLIRPAVLARLGRKSEASQQLQAARIFLTDEDDSVKEFMTALGLAVKRDVPFEVPKDVRVDDPVIAELWRQL